MKEHKGFDPSHKKIKKALEKGQLPKAPIFLKAAAIFIILASSFSYLPIIWLKNQQMVEWCLSIPEEGGVACGLNFMGKIFTFVTALLFVTALVVTALESWSAKFSISWNIISLNFEKLSPVSGLQRIWQGLIGCWQHLLRVILLLLFVTLAVKASLDSIGWFIFRIDARAVEMVWSKSENYLYAAVALVLVFGGFEYLYNRKKFNHEHSMSHDEMRREYKEEEGDPHIKYQRRALHEAIIMQEMMRRVRGSRVIITD